MSPSYPLPGHAYVPGRTARHPDGAFDALRQTAFQAQGAEALARSDAWLAGLQFLDQGYFWEAHEVLEPVWMQAPQNSAEKAFCKGAIQLANARLKLAMGRPRAAARLCAIARSCLQECRVAGRTQVLGRPTDWLAHEIDLTDSQLGKG